MSRVRSIRPDQLSTFTGRPGDPTGYDETVRSLWDSGASRPGWCFPLEDAGPGARIGFRTAATVPDPAHLGSLPPLELFTFGLHLPWDEDPIPVGVELVSTALAAIRDQVPELLEWRITSAVHPHPATRVALCEALGMTLFHEKQGYLWEDPGRPMSVPDRLEFRDLDDVGDESYAAIMGALPEGTLDRNDRYYWAGTGRDNWGRVFVSSVDDADRASWLAAFRDGEPVGMVALSDFDWEEMPNTATIAFIGVVPAHRGNGYVGDLMAAGTAVAQRRGFTRILSDVDTLNAPMRAAMERADHRDAGDAWQVWVYRAPVAELAGRALP